MARMSLALLVAALAGSVAAGVQFTGPAAGSKQKAGETLLMEWKDGGTGPAISALSNYVLELCAGSNDNPIVLKSLVTGGSFSAGNTAQVLIQAADGGKTDLNAYLIKMTATTATGGKLTVYSDRFALSGMTAAFPQAVTDGLSKISGTSGPAAQDDTANKGGAADSLFAVQYTMQTGPTRYAPMQPVPGTKVDKNKPASMMFPTSSVPLATTKLAIPTIVTTVTQSQTHSVSSNVNSASPAPMPQDDMARFLNRWKD